MKSGWRNSPGRGNCMCWNILIELGWCTIRTLGSTMGMKYIEQIEEWDKTKLEM